MPPSCGQGFRQYSRSIWDVTSPSASRSSNSLDQSPISLLSSVWPSEASSSAHNTAWTNKYSSLLQTEKRKSGWLQKTRARFWGDSTTPFSRSRERNGEDELDVSAAPNTASIEAPPT